MQWSWGSPVLFQDKILPVGKAFESSRFWGVCRVKRNHEISIEKGILVNIHVQLMHYFEEVFGKMQIIKEFKLCLLVKFI